MSLLAIIHTTVATVVPLKGLAAEMLPECRVYNYVDDSILPQLALESGNLAGVEERVISYARFAESAGADIILEACSSIGELVPKMQQRVTIPVVRIDEAMAKEAIARFRKIVVCATLATTLEPTMRLLHEKAAAAHKVVTIAPTLVSDAYKKLMAGDQAGHDEVLSTVIAGALETSDCIVLAQASMARVLPRLSSEQAEKCLTSPRRAMEQVKTVLEEAL